MYRFRMPAVFLLLLLIGTNTAQNCQPIDVVFLMDGSDSVGKENFNTMLSSVAELTQSFHLGPNAIQVGAIVYAEEAQVVFDLDTYTDHEALQKVIRGIPYLGGIARTDLALKLVREEFFKSHGARPSTLKLFIVLTNGRSASPSDTTNEAVKLRTSPGVNLMSVGIGTDTNQGELEILTTYTDNNYPSLSFKTQYIIANMLKCSSGPVPPSPAQFPPAFSVALTTSKSLKPNERVVYDKVYTNLGKAYDTKEGCFVAPMDGFYLFNVNAMAQWWGEFWLMLMHNDKYVAQMFAKDPLDLGTAGQTVILQLKQGDKMCVEAKKNSRLHGKPDEIYNTFSGFLLYPIMNNMGGMGGMGGMGAM